MTRLALLVLFLLCPVLAQAQRYGPQNIGGTNIYQGPGNVVGGATGWWGLRGYSSASASSSALSAQLLRASDSSTYGIRILSNGRFDTATAQTFCAGTTCTVQTLFDQSGNGYDLTQATAANQPQLLFNCFGFAPCMQFTASSSQILVNSGFTNVAQPHTVEMVAERTANFTTEMDAFSALSAGYTGSVEGFWGVANWLFVYAGSNSVYYEPFSDQILHAMVFINNGASSSANVDGTVQSASQTPGSGGTYSTLSMGGNAAQTTHYLTGYMTEMGIWPLGMNSTQASQIVANQQANWR